MPDVDGRIRSLDEFLSAGPVLLVLFKVSCPTCQFTLPFLERLQGGRIQVIGISQDDAEWTREFNTEFGLTFPTLTDLEATNYPVSNAFGITSVPSLFLVQPDGRISWTSAGFSRQSIEELGQVAGVPVLKSGEHVPEWKSG